MRGKVLLETKTLLSGKDLLLTESIPVDYVIEGLIQAGTVNLVIGDSGLGKSALMYQMGVCVAAGIPFLGLPVKPTPVLMLDYENGTYKGREIVTAVSRFVGLAEPPETFYRWKDGDEAMIETLTLDTGAGLILIDALRGYNSQAERDNPTAGAMLSKLYRLAHKSHAAIVLVHHTRKPDVKFPPPGLDDLNTRPLTWMYEGAGPRSLVNQTHTRLGIGPGKGDVAMVLRAHIKTEGEFGPLFVERVFDEHGDPSGYVKVSALEAALTPDQRRTLQGVPKEFILKQARLVYGRKDQATIDFLRKALALGLIKKTGLGTYVKLV